MNDLDASEQAFEQLNSCYITTIVGLRVLSTGDLAIYFSDGRDWHAYLGAATYFIRELSGEVRPPAVGQLAKRFFGR